MLISNPIRVSFRMEVSGVSKAPVNAIKPQQRTKLRIALGRFYYTFRRNVEWYTSNTRFAKARPSEQLPVIVFQHQTPLLRQLKGVDMWLQHNKVKNLSIAVEKINNIVIQPGETFSYWKLIGNPTRHKGYVDGMVLHYGGFHPGVGGGLCQLSNLIYWMTLHTPLTVVERHRHSYDVFPDSNRTQPFGSGATCVYNYVDLQIRNDNIEPFQLCVRLTDENLVGEWRAALAWDYTYEVYEQDHSIKQEYWGAYVRRNTIYRRIFNADKGLVADEFVTCNVAIMMYEPFLTEGTPHKRKLATMKDPTQYPDVNEVIQLLLASVQDVLGIEFLGMYLYGSLASGDFNTERSDIDFVVTTANELSPETVSRLAVMHHRIYASGLKWAKKLEGAYITKNALRSHNANDIARPCLNEGKFYQERLGSDWVIQRHILREQGVAVAGPDLKELIYLVRPDDLRQAVKGILQEWWAPMLNDPAWIKDSEYQVFAVLTMCRALHTIKFGEIVSKRAAAAWAQDAHGQWNSLIKAALAWWCCAGEFDHLSEVLEFIKFTVEYQAPTRA